MRADDSQQVTEDGLLGEREKVNETDERVPDGKKQLNDNSVNVQFLLTLTSATITELYKDADVPQQGTAGHLISLSDVLPKCPVTICMVVSMVAFYTRDL